MAASSVGAPSRNPSVLSITCRSRRRATAQSPSRWSGSRGCRIPTNETSAMGDEHTGQAPALAAAAVVALASALDQGTKGVLDFLLQSAPHEGDLDTGRVIRLRSAPLFERLRELPSVMSRGSVRVRRDHSAFVTLREMITLRNELAHPDALLVSRIAHGTTAVRCWASQQRSER